MKIEGAGENNFQNITQKKISVLKEVFFNDSYELSEEDVKVFIPARFQNAKLKFDMGDGAISIFASEGEDVVFHVVLKALNEKSLKVNTFEAVTEEGIATEFYTRLLPEVAKKCGFRFLTGNNNQNNIDFFLSKIGRVHIADLTEEGFYEIGIVGMHTYTTIQFLYPEDKERFTGLS